METKLTEGWFQSQAQALDSAAHDCDGIDAHAARSHREAAQAWRLAARALRLCARLESAAPDESRVKIDAVLSILRGEAT